MGLRPIDSVTIGIVGLGYVGLPLAVEMSRHFPVLGFDNDPERVRELAQGMDRTREVSAVGLSAARRLSVSAEPEDLRGANFYVVTVPTPVNQALQPDLGALIRASETVGRLLGHGDVVVYESTVYPGLT